MIIVAFASLLACTSFVEIQPTSRVVQVQGNVEVRTSVAGSLRKLKKGDDIPAKATIKCQKNSFAVILTPSGKKLKFPTKTGLVEFERVDWTPCRNPRIERAFASRWEPGGTIRGGRTSNLWFPLDGSVRPAFMPFAGTELPTGTPKVKMWISFAGQKWELPDTSPTDEALTDQLIGTVNQYREKVTNVEMVLHVLAETHEFVSSTFSVMSAQLEKQLDEDLKELASLFANHPSSELLVAKAGLLNAYGLRTEAVGELEKCIKQDATQKDVIDALKFIYKAGGKKDEEIAKRIATLMK